MTNFLAKKVYEVFGHSIKEGDLGIEVEVESNQKLPTQIPDSYWKVLNDGSLRGEAKEYVFSKPLAKEVAFAEVRNLYLYLDGKVNDSMRAGVHVHVNCQRLTIKQLFTVMAAYYCLENLLTEDAGEERQGNLFCLRLSDADYVNTGIMGCLTHRDFLADGGIFSNENLRYGAMNLVSVSKFGSLEFRALRTPQTADKIIEWADLFLTLKENTVKEFSSPVELLNSMSANGGAEVVRKLLGAHAEKQISKPNFEESLYEGIRQIQHWVFLNNWETK
jgi:hypothetical protein